MGLMHRRNKTDYPNLNIWLFFDLVSKLDQKTYYRLVSPVFNSQIENICEDIKNLLEKYDSHSLKRENIYSLLELLLCLSPIIPTGFQINSSVDIYFEITDKNQELSAKILKKYMENKTSLISQTLLSKLKWRAVTRRMISND